jgi:GDP-L-fucose synthase
MQKDSTVYVAGADTLIGAAIVCELQRQGHTKLVHTLAEAEYVFMAAGKSGGIQANQKYPADLMRDNLAVNCEVVDNAFRSGVKKLLYLASSCCYPKECPQPMRPESLMTGPLEVTNEAYAIAKLSGIKLCQAYYRQYGASFISAIPANVFGPGDDFSPDDSHVIAALIRRMHEAKVTATPFVELWGSGKPEREFIYAEDLANACLFVMKNYDEEGPLNIGAVTQRFSIRELADLIKEAIGYTGRFRFDATKPDGTPRKILDSSVLENLGWKPRIDFRIALSATYNYFLRVEEEKNHA